MNNCLDQNINSLIDWMDEINYDMFSLSIGHNREETNINIAACIANKWIETQNWVRSEGGYILNVVDWPESAASWLRQAKQLNQDNPDAWVIISSFKSAMQILQRLSAEKNWIPERTFCLFSSNCEMMNKITPWAGLNGLKGLLTNGRRWIIEEEKLIIIPKGRK